MMLDAVDIREKVVEFISTLTSSTSRETLESHTGLLSSELIDSIGFIQLILFIERIFSISIEQEELVIENFDSVDAITAFIQLTLEK
jgi:acyl carrier protein